MSLALGLRICIANKFSGDAAPKGLDDHTLRTALRETIGRNEG